MGRVILHNVIYFTQSSRKCISRLAVTAEAGRHREQAAGRTGHGQRQEGDQRLPHRNAPGAQGCFGQQHGSRRVREAQAMREQHRRLATMQGVASHLGRSDGGYGVEADNPEV